MKRVPIVLANVLGVAVAALFWWHQAQMDPSHPGLVVAFYPYFILLFVVVLLIPLDLGYFLSHRHSAIAQVFGWLVSMLAVAAALIAAGGAQTLLLADEGATPAAIGRPWGVWLAAGLFVVCCLGGLLAGRHRSVSRT